MHAGQRHSQATWWESTPLPQPASRSSPTTSRPAIRATPSRSTPPSPWRAIEAGSSSSTVHIGQTAFLGVEINASDAAAARSGGSEQQWGRKRLRRLLPEEQLQQAPGRRPPAASIASVVTNGPAQEAGLAEGDVDHLNARRQDDRYGQRPHQRRQKRLPPGRQGDDRLDRRVGPDPHGHRAALVRSSAVALRTPARQLRRPLPPYQAGGAFVASELSPALAPSSASSLPVPARVAPWRSQARSGPAVGPSDPEG